MDKVLLLEKGGMYKTFLNKLLYWIINIDYYQGKSSSKDLSAAGSDGWELYPPSLRGWLLYPPPLLPLL